MNNLGSGLDAEWTDFEHTGPGTLAGRYMRMFWHPVYRSEDLSPGWAVPIMVMSEEMTLYRGESGTVHLVAFQCAHRGTQLSTGWVEDDCIRCRYHGWKYDGSGQCVEQPMEDSAFAAKVRIRSYPVQEYRGLVFAYLGEGSPPALPRYPALEDEGVLEVGFNTRACNWVNQLENDPGHGAFVHRNPKLPKGVFYYPEVTVEETEYGLADYSKYPNGELRISHTRFPNTHYRKSPPTDPALGWRTTLAWWLPIDDENAMHFRVDLVPVRGDAARRYLEGRHAWAAEGGREFDAELSQLVLAGNLLIDDIERDRPDINVTRVQDDATQIGQGVIRNRTQERLGRSDAYVLLVRRIWERELRALVEGRPLKQWGIPTDVVVTDGDEKSRALKGVVYQI